MKRFVFDALVDEENICNLEQERDAIQKAIQENKKLIIYAPRNFGKTSLVKNVVLPTFRRKHKKCFIFFADLMGVKNWESIEHRIERSFAVSFADSFPAKQLLETAKKFISGLRPQIAFDAQTGAPTLTFSPGHANKPAPLDEILHAISLIQKEFPSLMVLDEFQDIAFVEEAEAKLRSAFQELDEMPIIFMGSKRHILSNIFAKPSAPLASFGQDLEFNPITFEEYHDYIEERFASKKLSIDLPTATHLQKSLNRIPEDINIVCAHIMDAFENTEVSTELVNDSIVHVVLSRQSRFEQFLSTFSSKEEEILVAIAKHGPIKHYNSSSFLKTVSSTSRMVGIIINNLWNKSVLEKDDTGYRVADPLLREYLSMFR